MSDGEARPGPVIDVSVLLLAGGLPWLLPAGWGRLLAAALGFAVWIGVVRPTWRGLLPFFGTCGLAVQAVVLLVLALLR